ncbi:S1 RNA-binding domain-containing protein [Bacillus velezensis]|uniref:S1 RNA-binding domain-containing protein n=1 Tax=Bacillus velezensis TaxID=492670 RepID=UPI002FFF3B4D
MTEEMNQIDVQVPEVGDVVKGIVTKVEDKHVDVEIVNVKQSGIIPISELSSLHVEKASDVVKVDDELDLKVTKVEDDALILSKRAVDADRAWEDLEKKFDTKEVFEAEVKDVVKGGLVVDIGVRGFIPASLVEAHFVEDFTDYKGKTLSLIVVELDRDKNRVILSHRAVVEKEQTAKKHDFLQTLEVGSVLEGKVQRLVSFGAFVEILPGVEGLVHISQISNKHIGTPHEVLEEGQTVKVKVLDVNESEERISLSMRELEEAPKADQEDFRQYQAKEEPSTGFQLGDLIGDKLNKLK